MSKSEIEMKGWKEIDKVLKMLPRKMGEDVLTRATKSGATIVKNEVVRRAPVGKGPPHPLYGRLKNNIKTVKLKYQRNRVTMAVHTGDAFWAHFLEFGTGRYYEGTGTYSKGSDAKTHMPAHPFFRPAWDATHEKALAKVMERLRINIGKAAEQLAGRYRSLSKAQRRRIAG